MRYSPESEIILETTDTFGCVVRFHKKNYDNHKDKHPELRQKQFCPTQIAKALREPTLTIEGKQDGTLCYYLELFRKRDIVKYVKVVVLETNRLSDEDPHCIIKTAFKPDHVQEFKYGFVPTYYNNIRGAKGGA